MSARSKVDLLADGSLRYTPAEARQMIRDIQREAINPERLGRAILAHRDALRKPGKLLWHICGEDCSVPIAAAYLEGPER